MMPRGAEKLALSKMHMGGTGLSMIKGSCVKKKVPMLLDLIALRPERRMEVGGV